MGKKSRSGSGIHPGSIGLKIPKFFDVVPDPESGIFLTRIRKRKI
jgi:hypothetical protein